MIDCILAVDAGGTKTKVCLIDFNKNILYEETGGPGSPAVLGINAIEYIFELVTTVFNKHKSQFNVRYIQMGISGLGTIQNKEKYELQLSRELGVKVSLENDAILALFSIVEDKHQQGALVLAGTGSACYGVDGLNTLLIGGWGHLLSEHGSSYTAVRTLVLNTIKAYELGQEIPRLGQEFMKLINITEVNDFKVFMYNNVKADIATYAQFISERANDGDLMAIDILKQSGRELAESIKIIFERLSLSDNAVIGFRGSFIEKAPFVKEEFFKVLHSYGYYPQVVSGSNDPIYGAYYMALRKIELC